jgi:tRNA (guanine37-N1)-methyltransferase
MRFENMTEDSAAESLCLRLDRRKGESALRILRQLQLLDGTFKVGRDDDELLIPLLRELSEEERSLLGTQLRDFKIVKAVLARRSERPQTIFDALKDRLAPNQLASLPRSIDIVGDIGIVELPEELHGLEEIVGDAVLRTNKNIHTVLAKVGPVFTDKRLRQLQVIAGSGVTETTHKEYGCMFRVDVTKAYFSPRLSLEHDRVASQVRENETVVDMFAGIGPFAIQIAKRRKNVRVYAIDVNEDAIRYLQENVRLNKVEDKVIVKEGNARTIVETYLVEKSDRIIMNLPVQSARFVDVACLALKPAGGIVHYYTFVSDPDPLAKGKEELSEAVLRAGRRLDRILQSRTVKGTAPHEWLLALDGFIR